MLLFAIATYPRRCFRSALLFFLLILVAVLPATGSESHRATVFVASTRLVDGLGRLAAEPVEGLRYSVYTVEAPDTHRPGRLSPHFRIAGEQRLLRTSKDFSTAILEHADSAFGSDEVLVYVHGFANSFGDSLNRAAQIAIDLDIPASTVLYAWPSANRVPFYARDVDQAAASRDGLARLLRELAASSASRIVVAGHSLGARLALETLVDLARQGRHETLFRKLGGLALLAPDIAAKDFDSLLRQAPALAGKVVVYGSSRDLVLRNAPALDGVGLRVGDLRHLDRFGGAEVIVVDVGAVPDHLPLGHYPLLTSPTLIRSVNGTSRPDLIIYARALAAGALPGAEVTRRGAATLVVLPRPVNR